MSTRKEALQELLAKVEAGDDAGVRRSNEADPARAWLIAIIKALIAQEARG